MTRIALSIGISTTKGLADLPAAAPSARVFADWARGHGFDVREFNSQDKPVTSEALLAAGKEIADTKGIEQVFVFFAGHGVAAGHDEDYWLLSGGYEDPIDASASTTRARANRRLRHVAFFADACRTSVPSQFFSVAKGSPAVFPSRASGNTNAVVDIFNSTISGRSAMEVIERGTDQQIIDAHGIFTKALQDALNGDVGEVRSLHPSTGATVIYAGRLKPYLDRIVPEESSRLTGRRQTPDIRPTSGQEHALIELGPPQQGTLVIRAKHPDGSPAAGSSIAVLEMSNVANPIERASGDGPELTETLPAGIYGVRATKPGYVQEPLAPEPLALLTGRNADNEVLLRPSMGLAGDSTGPEAQLVERYVLDQSGRRADRPSEDGVYTVVHEDVLTGRVRTELRVMEAGADPTLAHPIEADDEVEGRLAEFARAPTRHSFETETGISITGAFIQAVLGPNEGWGQEPGYAFVRGYRPGSVMVQFEDGLWGGFAHFPGFLGEAVLSESGVESLRYRPAPGGPWDESEDPDEERRLLVLAEAAFRAGRTSLLGADFVEVAGRMREFKHRNPMLGVYAAYAYAEADEVERVDDMIGYFVAREQAVPYDIVMLSSRRLDDVREYVPVAPDFPILRRGWSRILRAEAPPPLLVDLPSAPTTAMFTTFPDEAGRVLGERLEGEERDQIREKELTT